MKVKINSFEAFIIESEIESFAETILIRLAFIYELVFDSAVRKEEIERLISEFRAVVSSKDSWS